MSTESSLRSNNRGDIPAVRRDCCFMGCLSKYNFLREFRSEMAVAIEGAWSCGDQLFRRFLWKLENCQHLWNIKQSDVHQLVPIKPSFSWRRSGQLRNKLTSFQKPTSCIKKFLSAISNSFWSVSTKIGKNGLEAESIFLMKKKIKLKKGCSHMCSFTFTRYPVSCWSIFSSGHTYTDHTESKTQQADLAVFQEGYLLKEEIQTNLHPTLKLVSLVERSMKLWWYLLQWLVLFA